MESTTNSGYMKGFIPYAIACAVMSLCGGFTAAVPTNIVAEWDMATAVTFITLAYSVGAAAMAPVMGKIGDVLGRRTTLLISLGLYTLGQLLIAICPTGVLPLLLLFRFMVGVGAAGIAPCVMAYIMMEFPPEKMGQGFTIYMFIACGMVIFGPVLGGIVMGKTGWRPVMWICVVACVISLALCFIMIKKTESEKKSMAGFDFVGAIFVLIFFAMVLCVPTFGQNAGWTAPTTLICAAVAVVALIILVAVEKKAASPILNGKFMARKQFILPVIVLFLSQGLLQACMTNIIVYAKYGFGDTTVAGLATSIMYLGMALGTIILGPQADKKEPRIVASIALIFVLIGAALQLTLGKTLSVPLTCAALFFIGLGLGGNGTIFMKVVLSGCAPELAGAGSGTYNVFKDMSAPFGVALFVPMMTGGLAAGIAERMGAGMDQAAATLDYCVTALHKVAIAQIVCVVIGIVVCLMLPKVYGDKKEEA